MQKQAGNGPPKDEDASDLWAKITTLPRAHKVVDFPRNDADGSSIGRVAIVVLTGDEVHLANLNAEKFIRKAYKDTMGEVPKVDEMSGSFKSMYNSRAAREILFRSCKKADHCEPGHDGVCIVDHDKMNAFFPTQEAIGKLTTDEAAVLMGQYLQTQSALGPIVKLMSQAEMDNWLEMLARGGSVDPLVFLSSEDVIRLLMHSASLLYPSPMDSSSHGTRQDASTNDG